MVDARSVLVLTDRYDPTADLVVEELNRRGVAVFRCDTSEFPTPEVRLAGWIGVLTTTPSAIR